MGGIWKNILLGCIHDDFRHKALVQISLMQSFIVKNRQRKCDLCARSFKNRDGHLVEWMYFNVVLVLFWTILVQDIVNKHGSIEYHCDRVVSQMPSLSLSWTCCWDSSEYLMRRRQTQKGFWQMRKTCERKSLSVMHDVMHLQLFCICEKRREASLVASQYNFYRGLMYRWKLVSIIQVEELFPLIQC